MLFKIVVFALAILATTSYLAGQTRFPEVKEVFVPPFPPVALAVQAEGDVHVAVEVDEKGNVLAANAISGLPLLRAAAEAAAQKWTFTSQIGKHFLTLRFVFRLGDFRKKKDAKLIGTYTLSTIEPKVRVVQTVSHSSTPNPE